MSDRQPAKIGDNLADLEFSILMQSGLRLVVVKLFYNAFLASPKGLQFFRGPPSLRITLGVELSPSSIECVCQFVPNNRPNRAVIHSVITLGVEERRLQDAGREHEFIH